MDQIHLPILRSGGPYRHNIDHIRDELARIELLVRAQVIRWRKSATCAGAAQDWGMVVISDDEIQNYLRSPVGASGWFPQETLEQLEVWWREAARLRAEIDELCATNVDRDFRLLRLAKLFKLSSAERDLLLICLLADCDERYRRLFAYLENDASRQSLSVELITQILRCVVPEQAAARDLFSPSGSLVKNHLIVIGGDASGPDSLPLRSVRIDDRVASYLLGSDTLDSRVANVLKIDQIPAVSSIHARPETVAYLEHLFVVLRANLEKESPSLRLLFHGRDSRLAVRVATAAARTLEVSLLEFDVQSAVRSEVPWSLLIDLAYREARLAGAALLFSGCGAVLGLEQDGVHWAHIERAASEFHGLTMAEVDASVCGNGMVSDVQFWQIDLPLPDYETRKEIWLKHLPPASEMSMIGAERIQLSSELANSFQNTASQIEDAIIAAMNLARRDSPDVNQILPRHLFEACRRQAGKRLVSFAQRIEPRRTLSLDDVVLPAPNKRQLVDLSDRIRHHRELFHKTGLDQKMRIGKGLLALFTGASGTGKTMAAEALANQQGVDLYKVDLSALVSKYIGETEKNLSRIFTEAESSNGWLFFDEGESLFGSRGEVKQAQDRFLNLEVNYLLQRIEEFSGVVILATNLRQHIDDAFLRRIHALVEFPQPNAELRSGIWQKLTPALEHRDFDDHQLQKFAARFEISGGNIRNVVLDAMFRAYASKEKVLTLRHLAAGLGREYQKLGRPITNAEFGDTLYTWVIEDILSPAPEGARANGAS